MVYIFGLPLNWWYLKINVHFTAPDALITSMTKCKISTETSSSLFSEYSIFEMISTQRSRYREECWSVENAVIRWHHHHYVPFVVNRSAVTDLHRSRSCATLIQSLYDIFVHSLMLSVHIVLGLPRPHHVTQHRIMRLSVTQWQHNIYFCIRGRLHVALSRWQYCSWYTTTTEDSRQR